MTRRAGTVLVVDDDGLNRLLLATSLEEEGYAVETAEDGGQALVMLHARPYDVVLLDLLMPEMDGYQVLEQMKSDSSLRHIPVIVISAMDDMESVIRCIEMGAMDHLPKPFDPVLLRARINASMSTKRLRDMEQAYVKQIQRVSARLQAIFEGAAIGIVVTDTEGRVAESNPALQRMLGYSAEELRRTPFAQYSHPEDAAEDAALFLEMVAGKRETYQLEKRYLRKEGQLLWGRLTVSLVRDGDGVPQFGIGMVEDVTQRKEAEARLLYLSTHDALTDLYNRAYFEEEISRLQRGRRFPVSLVMVDVDGLKGVNDVHGHAAGDDLLRRAAAVLRDSFRAEDVVARIGGDEFAVLLPATDAAAMGVALARTRDNLYRHNTTCGGPRLSFSTGVATAVDPAASLMETLKQADQQMYRVKMARRGSA